MNQSSAIVHDEPTSVGEWIITLIITGLPLIGLIMLFVWAFGSTTSTSKANWAKAALIIYAVLIVLGILFGGALLAFVAASGDFNY